jgi:hypothetical protein
VVDFPATYPAINAPATKITATTTPTSAMISVVWLDVARGIGLGIGTAATGGAPAGGLGATPALSFVAASSDPPVGCHPGGICTVGGAPARGSSTPALSFVAPKFGSFRSVIDHAMAGSTARSTLSRIG